MKQNKKHIAEIVCRFYKQHDGTVEYRKNASLDPSIIAYAKTFIKKPLLQSWSNLIPQLALSCPPIFEGFASRIFLTFRNGKWAGHSWDGDGNLQLQPELARLARLSTDDQVCAFTVLLADEMRQKLHEYLQDPCAPVDLNPKHLRLVNPIKIKRD